jgi:hypothetical protein
VLGIAALVGAMVTIALLIVLTHDSETQKVKPLPKDTATHPRGGDEGGEVVLGDPWIGGSSARSSDRTRKTKTKRSRGHGRNGTGGAGPIALRSDDRKPNGDGASGTPRAPAARPKRPNVPGPSGPPTQPASPAMPAPSSQPVSTEPVTEPDDSGPVTQPSVPDTHIDTSGLREVVIEDGEIEHGGGKVKVKDGHLRLRIRSDELVLVDVEDRPLSWVVPVGGETLIEFDTTEKDFKLDLHHHKGALVLHLRD